MQYRRRIKPSSSKLNKMTFDDYLELKQANALYRNMRVLVISNGNEAYGKEKRILAARL